MNVFLNTLEELASGQTALELHDKLKELIGVVRATGKKGTLTLTLAVKPGQSATSPQIVIEDNVTVKPPKVGRDVSVFFADGNNNLTRHDPRQPKLWAAPAPTSTPAPVPAGVDVVTGEITQ